MIICHWEWIWLKEIMPKPLTQIMYQLLLIIFCQTALYFILFIPLACPLPLYLVVYLVPGFYKDTGGKNQWISWNCFCFRLKPCKPARTCKHFPSSKSRHSPFHQWTSTRSIVMVCHSLQKLRFQKLTPIWKKSTKHWYPYTPGEHMGKEESSVHAAGNTNVSVPSTV